MRRIIIGAAALTAIAMFASGHPASADHRDNRHECIVFEDDSFMCGTATPGGWLDRTQPMVVGCIPDGLCDSPDAFRGEGLDNQYSEAVFPLDDPRSTSPIE